VEVRVCDMPANLEQVLSLAALIQCLVVAISNEIDEGAYLSETHPMMVEQNKWRATRFGAGARLVDSDDYKQHPVQETVGRLVQLLLPTAERLDCLDELKGAVHLPDTTGAQQQL